MDFEESVRPSKVLQGQENTGSASSSPLQGFDVMNRRILDFAGMQQSHANPVLLSGRVKDRFGEFVDSTSLDLDRFPRVLQGQEICSLRSFPQIAGFTPASASGSPNPFAYQANKSSFYPLASQGIRSSHVPYQSPYNAGDKSSSRKFDAQGEGGLPKNVPFKIDMMGTEKGREVNMNASTTGCKLFGFSLPVETPASNQQSSSKRICTKVKHHLFFLGAAFLDVSLMYYEFLCFFFQKVHKQGSLVGRAIDLSRLNGYNDLLTELERLFNMEGLLRDPEKGWRILYTDSENDMMVVGDDPWQ